MKKVFTFLVAVLITASSFAQSPEKMSYQAVLSDSNDNLINNQAVGMRLSILQNTATGTAVYVETQTVTTNDNGLVTLAIGTGSVLSGDFATIDWGGDSYFIQTEMDPEGGDTYTLTGASQLLSVPYALHSKTAGSVTETQSLADVVALSNSASGQLKDVTDPTEAQDATTKVYVDALIVALDARVTALESEPESGPATVGDIRAGGVVFWVDPQDNTHGLVCAMSDYEEAVVWGCNGTDLVNVPNVPYNGGNPLGAGAEIGYGESNTNGILNDCPTAPAALAARTLGVEWFLPSINELLEMYLHRATLEAVLGFNAFSSVYEYWSSTEFANLNAWGQNFNSGDQYATNKLTPSTVRAVRAF
ncbi:hypothetical protein [Patiriisocius sp. Uisw_047]|uniref:hypothetical protein n=1 Tax=Patiriisocius sp. Uisw_047 TaxID=3230969 RepID=UPI0039E876D4